MRSLIAIALALSVAAAATETAGLAKGVERTLAQASALRPRAGAADAPVQILPAGSVVKLVAAVRNVGGTWWYVDAGTRKGWVAEADLTATAPVPAPPAVAAAPESAPPPAIEPEDRSAEAALHVEALKTRAPDTLIATCKALPFSGLEDARLFDEVEKVLGEQIAALRAMKQGKADEEGTKVPGRILANCGAALASSGNIRYLPTLEQARDIALIVVSRRAYRIVSQTWERHLASVSDFARLNRTLNDPRGHLAGEPWEVTRARNALRSRDLQLQREAVLARIKALAASYPQVYGELEAQLLSEHAQDLSDPKRADTVALMCKHLGRSHEPKYLPTLVKAAAGATSPKVQKHCEAAQDVIRRPPEPPTDEAAAQDEERG